MIKLPNSGTKAKPEELTIEFEPTENARQFRLIRTANRLDLVTQVEGQVATITPYKIPAGPLKVSWQSNQIRLPTEALAEIPLDGLVLWLRADLANETELAQGEWQDVRLNTSSATLSGSPVALASEDEAPNLLIAFPSGSKAESDLKISNTEASYYMTAAALDPSGGNLWTFGNGEGASWNEANSVWRDDFASTKIREVPVKPHGLAAQIGVVAESNHWTLHWPTLDAIRLPAESSGAKKREAFSPLRLGGSAPLAISEVMVYNRVLSTEEKQRVEAYQSARTAALESTLRTWIGAQDGEDLDFKRLNALLRAQLFAGNPPALANPNGPSTWYVDNQRGRNGNNGRAAKNAEKGHGPFSEIDSAYLAAKNGDTIVLEQSPLPYRITPTIEVSEGERITIQCQGQVIMETKEELRGQKIRIGNKTRSTSPIRAQELQTF